jgi:uncharacterized protein
MSIRTRSITVVVVATAAALLPAAAAQAASPDIVISQVYGGGGNSGATLTNDFIELYNRGAAAVDLTGWSVQYASAAGTSWQTTTLTGSVAPGAHYLVQEASGAGGTQALPSPDATGSIALSATNGKVALVTGTAALDCGATCATAAGVRDFVGYGTANDAEGGAAAPGLTNTTADLRAAGGATDTDNNAADFAPGAPDPRSTGGGGGTTPPPTGEPARIHDVQGASHTSPRLGHTVSVPGVVTAVAPNGFYLQDPEPDSNPATSEGIFVFTSTRPTVLVGDAATVVGKVTEFRPGNDATNLTTTELGSNPFVTVTAHGAAVPAPTLIGPGGRTPPPAPRADNPGDVEAAATFDVTTNALDFYESMEGMLVRIVDSVAAGPTNSFGELAVLPGNAGSPRDPRGGILYSSYADPNTERLTIADALAPIPAANTGDKLPGAIDGVLDYNFGNYMLEPLKTPTLVSGGITPETTRAQRPYELAVATYNVENLAPSDPPAKFDRLAAGIVTGLAAPDIVSVEEIQDNTGATDDGTVAADTTWQRLIDAITRAGGPKYSYRSINPTNDADGGQPGGNIRVGFLFRTDRGVSFVDRAPGDATTATDVTRVGLRAGLTHSPGRIAPTDPAFADSRKPLAGEFRFRGHPLIVVANHFNSKGGDQPLMGRYQPPARPSETQRHAQATIVNTFVQKISKIDPLASVVVLGDLNDFEFSQTADILTKGGFLTDLPRTLPANQRYSYVYEGNSEVLDHILISKPVQLLGYDYDVVHLNAEFADQTSDHDPQVVRLVPLF